MDTQKYSLRKFFLRFRNDDIEAAYRADIIDRTLIYFRVVWASVMLFGGIFGYLDVSFFKENAPIIITARILLLAFSAVVLGLSFWRPARRHYQWSPVLFILFVGTFCTLQTSLSPAGAFSPYVMGIFWAFSGGIFATVGLGFTFSFAALLASVLIFEIVVGWIWPVEPYIFLVYNFFYMGITSVFMFIAYLVELIARQGFVVSAQLRDSLAEVKTLSGMLPICSACKKIRDDKGYWNRIESYLATHSEINFSHGICPDCAHRLYPGFDIDKTD